MKSIFGRLQMGREYAATSTEREVTRGQIYENVVHEDSMRTKILEDCSLSVKANLLFTD